MAHYEIVGATPLRGEISVSGAKNAALPLLSACLLTQDEVVIENCPRIGDVYSMLALLRHLGVRCEFTGNTVCLCAASLSKERIPKELFHQIRSSVFLVGSLLSRTGRAELFRPGGCDIGARPVDQHLEALSQLGGRIEHTEDAIILTGAPLTGAKISLRFPSVGATENAMLAAALANGATTIHGAAREPEIVCLEGLLRAMGAKVYGAGSDTIFIEGAQKLHGAHYACIPDRIEAGTFLLAAAATNGKVSLRRCEPAHIEPLIRILSEAGGSFYWSSDALTFQSPHRLAPVTVKTGPYPLFATDLQAPLCAAACRFDGVSDITETIFENRMRHIPELRKTGARIQLLENTARIAGTQTLLCADFRAADLRAGAAVTLAALAAEGKSTVRGISLIERGYEDFPQKLSSLGASIRRIP